MLTDFKELENDVGFQQAVRTSHGRRPPVSNDFIACVIHKERKREREMRKEKCLIY